MARDEAAWKADCERWRGELLTGKYAHWCFDWDGLPVDETTIEFGCCHCFDDDDDEDVKRLKAAMDAKAAALRAERGVLPMSESARTQPETEPDFVRRLKQARTIVEGSVLYRRFISGTPLENDIAVWMEEFAAAETRALETERDMLRSHAESHNRDYATLAKKLDAAEAECERLRAESVQALARHYGCGEHIAFADAWRWLAERVELSRLAQELLETHKSNAATAEGALRERAESVQALRKALEDETARRQALERVLSNSRTVVQGLLALVKGECGSSVEDCIDVWLAERYMTDANSLAGGEAATQEGKP